MTDETTLSKRLKKINKILDTGYLLNEEENYSQITDYYKKNKWAYRLFHNWDGFLHMGISREGKYKKENLLEPVIDVEKYILKTKGQKVLELASGQGANSYYLANHHSAVEFYCLDLSTEPTYSNEDNMKFETGDFHDLKKFKNDSIDVVFIFEALCHSDNKLKVLKEVYRVLKKNGYFIIYDGYLEKSADLLSEVEKEACILTEKGMAGNKFEELTVFESYIKQTSFIVEEKEDLSVFILPTLKRFERLSKVFFKFKILGKSLKTILPEKFVRNSLSGYLMPVLIENKIAVYYKHVLRK